jgi:hypothetical protein
MHVYNDGLCFTSQFKPLFASDGSVHRVFFLFCFFVSTFSFQYRYSSLCLWLYHYFHYGCKVHCALWVIACCLPYLIILTHSIHSNWTTTTHITAYFHIQHPHPDRHNRQTAVSLSHLSCVLNVYTRQQYTHVNSMQESGKWKRICNIYKFK